MAALTWKRSELLRFVQALIVNAIITSITFISIGLQRSGTLLIDVSKRKEMMRQRRMKKG